MKEKKHLLLCLSEQSWSKIVYVYSSKQSTYTLLRYAGCFNSIAYTLGYQMMHFYHPNVSKIL